MVIAREIEIKIIEDAVRKHDLLLLSKTNNSIIPTLIVFPKATLNSYAYEFGAIIESDDLFS